MYKGTTNATTPGLYQVPQINGCSATGITYNEAKGRQLLAPRMRIGLLDVNSVTADAYSVAIRVVFGDADLLCSPSITDQTNKGSCSPTNGTYNPTDDFPASDARDITCRPGVGSQFCALSLKQPKGAFVKNESFAMCWGRRGIWKGKFVAGYS